MEQKFSNNSIDLQALLDFCKKEGKEVIYRKGEQLEREGDPARWFGFVTEGCLSTSREASATGATTSHGSRLRANSWLIILASCQANLPRLPSKP